MPVQDESQGDWYATRDEDGALVIVCPECEITEALREGPTVLP